jgi:hypothetical protein
MCFLDARRHALQSELAEPMRLDVRPGLRVRVALIVRPLAQFTRLLANAINVAPGLLRSA